MISLRKVNSVILIIIGLLLLDHMIRTVLYLFGLINYSPSFQATGRRLFLWLILHVIISLYLYLKDKLSQKNIRLYPKINNETKIQLISGILIIIFVLLHVITYGKSPVNTSENMIKIMHIIIDYLLFLSIFIHLKISIPRLMISYGFLSGDGEYERTTKIINIVLLILLIILFIAELIYYI